MIVFDWLEKAHGVNLEKELIKNTDSGLVSFNIKYLHWKVMSKVVHKINYA